MPEERGNTHARQTRVIIMCVMEQRQCRKRLFVLIPACVCERKKQVAAFFPAANAPIERQQPYGCHGIIFQIFFCIPYEREDHVSHSLLCCGVPEKGSYANACQARIIIVRVMKKRERGECLFLPIFFRIHQRKKQVAAFFPAAHTPIKWQQPYSCHGIVFQIFFCIPHQREDHVSHSLGGLRMPEKRREREACQAGIIIMCVMKKREKGNRAPVLVAEAVYKREKHIIVLVLAARCPIEGEKPDTGNGIVL